MSAPGGAAAGSERAPSQGRAPAWPIAYGRLLRLSLAPSALADVAAGIVLGSGGAWPRGAAPFALLLASAAVYHGAMALNDWSDREQDARSRPERPLPAGHVAPPVALGLGLALPLAGCLAALGVAPWLGLWALALALLASGYDLAGRGPRLGPALLALCRAGNLGFGIAGGAALAGAAATPGLWLPPLLYGAYVFAVSRLGRLEDDEDPRPLGDRPRAHLGSASAALLLVPGLALVPGAAPGGPAGALAALALVLAGARGLVREAWAAGEWTRGRVGRCMGLALRRLLVFSAACALLAADTQRIDAWLVAALALAGYPLSFALRRVFPPS